MQNNKDYQGLSKKLRTESLIMSVILGLCIALAASVLVAGISWIADFRWGFLIAIGILPFITVPFAFLFFSKIFKMSTKQVAKRVDDLGLEQRMITLLEYGESNSFISRKLREDTENKVSKVGPKDLKFRFPKWPFLALAVASILAISMVTTSTVMTFASHRDYLYEQNRLSAPNIQYTLNTAVHWNSIEGAGDGYTITVINDRGWYMRLSNEGVLEFFNASITLNWDKTYIDVSNFAVGHYTVIITTNAYGGRGQSHASDPFHFEIVDRIVFNANNAMVATGDETVVVFSRPHEFTEELIPRGPPSNPTGRRFYGWRLSTGSVALTNEQIVDSVAMGRFNFIAVWVEYHETISFLANNGGGILANVTLRMYPGDFRGVRDVPGPPDLTPAFTSWRGWAVLGDETRTWLTNDQIEELVHSGTLTFIGVWYDEDDLFREMIEALRAVINEAAEESETRPNPISHPLRDSLLQDVDRLYHEIFVVLIPPIPRQERIDLVREFQADIAEFFAEIFGLRAFINSLTVTGDFRSELHSIVDAMELLLTERPTLPAKTELVRETRGEIMLLLNAFNYVEFFFDANNGVTSENVLITQRPPLFLSSDVPGAPETFNEDAFIEALIDLLIYEGVFSATADRAELRTELRSRDITGTLIPIVDRTVAEFRAEFGFEGWMSYLSGTIFEDMDEMMAYIAYTDFAVLENNRMVFVAVWDWLTESDSESDSEDDPLPDDVDEIIDDALDEIESLPEEDIEDPGVEPPPVDTDSDNIYFIDGETPIGDVWQDMVNWALGQVAAGNVTPAVRDILQRYVGIVIP